MRPFTFYECFAGGGMARAGLGASWRCLFANDFDPMKVATYQANWGAGHIRCADVATLTTHDLPTVAGIWTRSDPEQRLHHLRGRLVATTGLADGSSPLRRT